MALVGLLVLALAVGLLLCLWKAAYSRPHNFPPGPPALPIWGSYLQLLLENFKFPYRALDGMTRRYNSQVLGFYLGGFPTVAACDLKAVKEVLNNPHLQGRVPNIALKERAMHKDLGIFFIEGPKWLEQRRFTLRHLRDYGFGRRSDKLEAEIEAELRDLVELIRGEREDTAVVRPSSADESARRVLLPDALFPSAINSLLPVYAGSRLPRSADALARYLGNTGIRFQRSSDATGGFLTKHSWLSKVAPNMSGFHDNVDGSEKMRHFLEKLIDEHKRTYSDDLERDFIDSYLRELKKREEVGEPTTFSSEQLALTLLDFFFPAITGLPTLIISVLTCLVHHPDVMQRVQQEIDSVVGRGRLPTLNDRPSLPYTEATLRETMRRKTLTPMAVFHKATEDTTLQGYSVPKDTAVVTCLYSVHMNKDLWGDPENFRPERFLTDDGKLTKQDLSLPFGAGKRLCPGETFARQNLFLTFATLMQNFMVKADGFPAMDCKINGVIETYTAFWAQFVPR